MKKILLFDEKNVSPDTDISYAPVQYANNAGHVSISGAQEKLFAIVDHGQLRLTELGEQSTHIIKPVPNNQGLMNLQDMPANECLTMQIASTIFGIPTAPCGLIKLANRHLAYIVRRFDVTKNGKLAQEDVCSLLKRTALTHGSDFKYQGSYLEIAHILQSCIPLWRFDMPQFVSEVIFNYLFANGDAHLKNFSLLQDKNQFRLSPAYDLLNTSLHINDSDFALSDGLGLPISLTTEVYDKTGHPTLSDFQTFAIQCGLTKQQADKVIAPFSIIQPDVENLCNQSFLSDKCKRMYLRSYQERMARFLRK